MNDYPFKIGRTRSCFFTKTQKNKLESAFEILRMVMKHQRFEEEILRFQWTNSANKRFHRFYHASCLSNRQVLNRIRDYKSYFEELGINEQVVVLPFSNRKEIQNYNPVSNPIIWIPLNCINADWYTPIHITSAILHELALLLGLDSSLGQMSNAKYDAHKVPNFLGNLIVDIAKKWKYDIADISDSFDHINNINQYNYFPASIVVGANRSIPMEHHQTGFDNLISTLLIEQEALFALQDDLTPSETTRLICIEEVINNLNNLKAKLIDSSLDGSEFEFKSFSLSPKRGKSN